MNLRLLPFLLLLLLSAGCAQIPATFEYNYVATGAPPVWPSAPEQPRLRYVGQLTGEENFPPTATNTIKDVGTRFVRWLVGLGGVSHNPVVLQRPQAVITAADGRVFVSDVSRQAVYVFDRAQANLAVWQNATDELRFEIPVGLALDEVGGRLFVADAGLKSVVVLNLKGEPLALIGINDLAHPTGVAWDAETKRLFVSDRATNSIRVYSESGEALFSFGEHGEGEGTFNGPTYLTWYGGELYVADTLNSRVQIFDGNGEFQRTFGRRGLYLGDLPRPKGVAVGTGGNIYVVESYYDYLLIFNHKGEFLLPIGGSGYGIGQFYLPAGVWVDKAGYVYVADMFNGRIKIFEFIGEVDGSVAAENGNSAAHERTGGF